MEDFTDFDILYLIKTPFFIGNTPKALEEISSVEVDSEDINNTRLKLFYYLRLLGDSGKMDELKSEM
jgi:hypothetical protein